MTGSKDTQGVRDQYEEIIETIRQERQEKDGLEETEEERQERANLEGARENILFFSAIWKVGRMRLLFLPTFFIVDLVCDPEYTFLIPAAGADDDALVAVAVGGMGAGSGAPAVHVNGNGAGPSTNGAGPSSTGAGATAEVEDELPPMEEDGEDFYHY